MSLQQQKGTKPASDFLLQLKDRLLVDTGIRLFIEILNTL
jgi:hypothetical protein